jgi:hypothetical protein
MNAGSCSQQVSLIHAFGLPTLPSPNTVYCVPDIALSRYPSAHRASRFRGSGFRHWAADSPSTAAESSSLSYGRAVHFQLLPTSPRDDAVTFCFRPESVYLKRTFTSLTKSAFRRTAQPGKPGEAAKKKSSSPAGRHINVYTLRNSHVRYPACRTSESGFISPHSVCNPPSCTVEMSERYALQSLEMIHKSREFLPWLRQLSEEYLIEYHPAFLFLIS